ncbi:MAG: hypothetical protein ABS75_04795 [Pelagibacterium sp. SCN 63-23]|nr:MAG: hypothetical protein ABS75_04795 [Pelagibacterium sp. SCN 63-23]
MLKAIIASPYRYETKERALLKVAPYLSADQLRNLLLGRGPAGPAQCAQTLRRHLHAKTSDKWLDPIIRQVQIEAVRSAGSEVIDGRGRINYKSGHTKYLVPALADLAVLELVRLKLTRLLTKLMTAFGR